MIDISSIFTIIFIIGGIFFLLVGSIGIIRLPDFYTRFHAVSKSEALGIILILTGLIIYEGFHINSLKLLLIMLFINLANPIGIHALGNAAYKRGLKPLFSKKEKEKQ